MQMMTAKRNRQPDPRIRLAQLTEDYENLAKEQKERILTLRNENAALSQRLKAYEEKEAALSAALVNAERAASQIINAARERAEGIIGEAREEERKTKERLREHTLLLSDLADRCDNIMKNIHNELRKAPKGFCLELINKKEA